jgi:hypothetical protein
VPLRAVESSVGIVPIGGPLYAATTGRIALPRARAWLAWHPLAAAAAWQLAQASWTAAVAGTAWPRRSRARRRAGAGELPAESRDLFGGGAQAVRLAGTDERREIPSVRSFDVARVLLEALP